MNQEYLALVKIGALLEKSAPGETIELEKMIGDDSVKSLIENVFHIHVYNGESAQHILDKILDKISTYDGQDSDMSDPETKIFA